MKKWVCFCQALLLLLSAGSAENGADLPIDRICVDFSKRAGVPLMNKFGLFNSGLVSLKQYERDLHLVGRTFYAWLFFILMVLNGALVPTLFQKYFVKG